MADAGLPAPTGPDDVDAWLGALSSSPSPGRSPVVVLAAVAHGLAARLGVPPTIVDGLRLGRLAGAASEAAGGSTARTAGLPTATASATPHPPLPADAGPGLLGQAHEVLIDTAGRRRRGAFYTPADVASRLVGVVAAAGRDADSPVVGGGAAGADGPGCTVADPACGGGAFLLAAAERLLVGGVAADDVVASCLWGVDLDESAVAVTEAVLVLWAHLHGGTATCAPHVTTGDTLLRGGEAFVDAPAAGFDLVVGNPPFLSQLGRDTARDEGARARLRERFGDAAYRYTDSAALFLVEAARLARPGGRLALVLPDSVLVAADARRARDAVAERTRPVGLWWAGEPVFDAGVRVCAPVLEVVMDEGAAPHDRRPAAVVPRWRGRGFAVADPVALDAPLLGAPSWTALTAGLTGIPSVTLLADRVLGDLCQATAGFRDQYYGLAGHVRELDSVPAGDPGDAVRLVTSGLIDPGRCDWGIRTTRFGGRRYRAPVVDLEGLRAVDPALATWADARLVPKVVVATQTRVVEAAVDVEGRWFPSVPTIAVTAEPERLWHVAAVLLAPPVSAWALARHTGAALSSDALKLSARQVLEIPLPTDAAAWDDAAALLQAYAGADGNRPAAGLEAFGSTMTRAYGASAEVLAWWSARLPRRP